MRNALVALAATTGLVVAGTYVLGGDETPAPLPPSVVGEPLEPTPGTGDPAELDRLVGAFEASAARSPDPVQLTFLGRLHLQRAKATGDGGSYDRAFEVLSQAVSLAPEDDDARLLLGSSLAASHDFAGALREALVVGLDVPGALAAASDARFELGEYDAALDGYAQLAADRPGDPSVLVRRTKVALLEGDLDGAASVADRAYEAALDHGVFGAGLASYEVLRSHVAFERGRYEDAAEAARRALAIHPGWHTGNAALGRSLAALGDLDGARLAYERVVAATPHPEHLAALAGILTALGSHEEAASRLAGVDLYAPNPSEARHVVTAWADAGVHPEEAVRLARADLRRRADVHGEDALAWALHRAGRPAEARRHSDLALRMGTRDARLSYHAGMISLALGDLDRARGELRAALALSPSFDPVHAPLAHEALAALG